MVQIKSTDINEATVLYYLALLMRFEVLMAEKMSMLVLCEVTPCGLAGRYQSNISEEHAASICRAGIALRTFSCQGQFSRNFIQLYLRVLDAERVQVATFVSNKPLNSLREVSLNCLCLGLKRGLNTFALRAATL
jgi:hypothetical protein